MIAFVRGMIHRIEKDHVIVENAAGIGMQIVVGDKTLNRLPSLGEMVLLYTFMQVLDNEFKLYGFLDQAELDLFLKIMGISGMGARAAMNILSTLTPNGFYQAIVSQDEKTLTKIPGIGKKSAERLIFELKDKVELKADQADRGEAEYGAFDDVLDAMEVLGYQRSEIMPLLMELKSQDELGERTEDNIKKVLRYKGKR